MIGIGRKLVGEYGKTSIGITDNLSGIRNNSEEIMIIEKVLSRNLASGEGTWL